MQDSICDFGDKYTTTPVMEGLPFDVILAHIAPHLSLLDYCRLCRCNRQYNALFSREPIWEQKVQQIKRQIPCFGAVYDSRCSTRALWAHRVGRAFTTEGLQEILQLACRLPCGKWWACNLVYSMLALLYPSTCNGSGILSVRNEFNGQKYFTTQEVELKTGRWLITPWDLRLVHRYSVGIGHNQYADVSKYEHLARDWRYKILDL